MANGVLLSIILVIATSHSLLRASEALPNVQDLIALDQEPIEVASALDSRCAITPSQDRIIREDPHHFRTAQVYANALAIRALAAGASSLPPGSIFMKVKRTPSRPRADAGDLPSFRFTGPDDGAIVLYTVMFKRQPGFQPKTGDWDYGVIDGGPTHWLQLGCLESCIDCHADFHDHDSLSRDYRGSAIASRAPLIFPKPLSRSLSSPLSWDKH